MQRMWSCFRADAGGPFPITTIRVIDRQRQSLFTSDDSESDEWTLNTGPFTIKEHVVITLMANVSINYAYSTDALLALQGPSFYNINLGWGFALLFTLSSQIIGISLAGMFRRFLVWPSAVMWPNQFANTSLFYALHDKSKSDGLKSDGWVISRYRYFFYVLGGMFC